MKSACAIVTMAIAVGGARGEEPREVGTIPNTITPPGRVTVFASGRDGYHTYRIPAIVVSTKGTLPAFCEGRVGGTSDNGNIDVVLRRSFDGGRTWRPLQLVWEEGRNVCGNPSPRSWIVRPEPSGCTCPTTTAVIAREQSTEARPTNLALPGSPAAPTTARRGQSPSTSVRSSASPTGAGTVPAPATAFRPVAAGS